MPADGNLDDPWCQPAADVLAQLSVDAGTGLSDVEAHRRRLVCGRNQLRATRRRHVFGILADQFLSVVIVLLVAAGMLALAIGDSLEGLAIFAVVGINAGIGFLTEWRAVRSMEALGRLGQVVTVAMRDGLMQRIAAEDLVPGDIVLLEGGDVVTADIRLIEAAKLQANESALSGESMPVSKSAEKVAADLPLMERSSMLFKGTAVTRGSAKGVVVRTGLRTELGRISELVSSAEAQRTPLEKRLDALGKKLVWVVLLIAAIVAIAGVLSGRETFLAIEVAIALAVAAIPEGLPIVATIALARGMWRMAKRNALIAKLSAVETLGATSIILTDKTGTLTENQMAVTAICLSDADVPVGTDGAEHSEQTRALLDDLLRIGALCSNASIDTDADGQHKAVGDPTEIALLFAAEARDIHRSELQNTYPELREYAFDPDTRLMATLHRHGDAQLVAVKGAPETVLPLCTGMQTGNGAEALEDDGRKAWLDRAGVLGSRGLRTLALARKQASGADDEPYSNLLLLGVVGLEDPPRPGVRDAIRRCHNAGINVLMVTGDHAATAGNIAEAVGIADAETEIDAFVDGDDIDRFLQNHAARSPRVFSRVSPEQKLALIDFYQRQHHVVAMTGDGVNDAPALKKADIGVAMGVRGTAVAKEAAAMVLQDDEFGTIVDAVEQGRAIYENIRKFVVYLLSCNISEVLVVSFATIAGAPLPLLPLQILFLNLVTDVFPALALGVGEGSPALMKEKPRPYDEPVLTRSHWMRIALHGLVIALTVLGAMAIAVFQLGFAAEKAVTISFCTLALAQIWHVFNMRRSMRQVLDNEITRNAWVWAAIVLCVTLVLAAVYLPVVSTVLRLGDPGISGWLVILSMSIVPLLAAPIVRLIVPRGTGA